jgi:hypothetical protein
MKFRPRLLAAAIGCVVLAAHAQTDPGFLAFMDYTAEDIARPARELQPDAEHAGRNADDRVSLHGCEQQSLSEVYRPVLPDGWRSVTLKNVSFRGQRADIVVNRDASGKVVLTRGPNPTSARYTNDAPSRTISAGPNTAQKLR